MKYPVRNIQASGKEHLPFSRRIVPDIPLVPLTGITPQHVGGDFPVRHVPPVIRIGFHQGVHELIGDRHGSLHPAPVIDGMQFEVMHSVPIAVLTVFIRDQCRLGHHHLLQSVGQFIHIVHFRSCQLYVF